MRTGQWRDGMSVPRAKYKLGPRGLLPPILLRRVKMLLMRVDIPGALRAMTISPYLQPSPTAVVAGEEEMPASWPAEMSFGSSSRQAKHEA